MGETASKAKPGTALDAAAMAIICENIRPQINAKGRECEIAAIIANPFC